MRRPQSRPARSVLSAFPARFALVAVGLVAALALAGCTSGSDDAIPTYTPTAQPGSSVPPSPSLERYYLQKVAWKPCGSGFVCATVTVPIDYADPAGGDLTVKVKRLPASDPAHRIGSLLINPGGPGASGLSFAGEAKSLFSRRIRAAYDIVGFDPRGVGASTPVKCLDDKDLDALIAYDQSPDTAQEVQGLVDINKHFADGCEQRSAKILAHVGSVDTARDMDVIRAVVGDSKLNFLGFSYGTFLGATYAEEFPARVGRLVLDGALDPTLTAPQLSEGQLGGFERALNAFLANCVARSDCPVGPTVADARAQILRLVADSDAHPLRSDHGRPVTQSLVVLGLLFPLYNQADWPVLRQALNQALGGDGNSLLYIADSYADRNQNGTYSSNQDEASYAVNCLDRADHSTIPQLQADATRFAKESPIFGAYFAWSDVPCTVWPVANTDTPHEIHAKGAAPILVVGTTRDPATPYQWAQALASQLDSGRLLTRVGDGHTAYRRGSACIDNAVDAYLLHGTLPATGTVCQT